MKPRKHLAETVAIIGQLNSGAVYLNSCTREIIVVEKKVENSFNEKTPYVISNSHLYEPFVRNGQRITSKKNRKKSNYTAPKKKRK